MGTASHENDSFAPIERRPEGLERRIAQTFTLIVGTQPLPTLELEWVSRHLLPRRHPLPFTELIRVRQCAVTEGVTRSTHAADRTLHLGLHELHPASFLIASGRPGTGHLCCTYGSVSVRAHCDFL